MVGRQQRQLTVTVPHGECCVKKPQVAVEAQKRVSTPSGRVLSGGDILAGRGENWGRGVPRIRACAEPCKEEHYSSVNCRQPSPARAQDGCRGAQPSRGAGQEQRGPAQPGRRTGAEGPSPAGVQDRSRGDQRSRGAGRVQRGVVKR